MFDCSCWVQRGQLVDGGQAKRERDLNSGREASRRVPQPSTAGAVRSLLIGQLPLTLLAAPPLV